MKEIALLTFLNNIELYGAEGDEVLTTTFLQTDEICPKMGWSSDKGVAVLSVYAEIDNDLFPNAHDPLHKSYSCDEVAA